MNDSRSLLTLLAQTPDAPPWELSLKGYCASDAVILVLSLQCKLTGCLSRVFALQRFTEALC